MDNRQSYSPHLRSSITVNSMMLELLVSACVLIIPALFIFGARPIALVFMGILGAALPEVVSCILKKEPQSITDFSALYTGVLTALLMPAGVPVWVPFAAGVFGAVVAKLPFGRLGRSVFSPAAAGFVFVSLAWGEYFEFYPALDENIPFVANWTLPEEYEFFKYKTPIQLLSAAQEGYFSDWGESLKDIFFFGMTAPVGAAAVLVILAVFAFMIFRKISAWQATAAFCAAVFVMGLIFRYDGVPALMSPVYELFCGWMLFAAVFLVGDITTAPRFASARVMYGIFCGILAVLLRRISACQGGEITAILIMNAVSPAIDRMAWNARQRGISLTALKMKVKIGFEKRMKQFED